MCVLRRGDFAVVGVPPVAWASRLVGAGFFVTQSSWVRERGDQVCQDTVMESTGPG